MSYVDKQNVWTKPMEEDIHHKQIEHQGNTTTYKYTETPHSNSKLGLQLKGIGGK